MKKEINSTKKSIAENKKLQQNKDVATTGKKSNDKAFEKSNIIEAGKLIKSLLKAHKVNGKIFYTRRALPSIQKDDQDKITLNPFGAEESTFTSTAEAMNSPKLRQDALLRAYKELEAFKRKYNRIEVLKGVIEAIDQVLVPPSNPEKDEKLI